jgi:hypothetical protein
MSRLNGIEVDAVDHPDTLDDTMGVATTILPPDQLYFMTVLFVKHRVVEDNIALWILILRLSSLGYCIQQPVQFPMCK